MSLATESFHSASVKVNKPKAEFKWDDPLLLSEQLTEDERLVMEAARSYCQEKLYPRVQSAYREERFDREIMNEMGELGFLGSTIDGYGCAGANHVCYGIVAREVERVDSGYRSAMSVQSSLVMHPIYTYGDEVQRQKYLPKLATGEHLGCFGLTEPNHGSNPGGMETNFKDMGDHYLLNGSKMWISNAPFADIAVVWAKNEEGRIYGLIVERGMEGFTTPETHGKWSLRASATGELVFDNVKVPKENLLPNKSGLGAPLGCLDSARFGIAWGAIGAAMDCYDTALRYSKERVQFDKPIGAFQLQQKKLAEMITEITKAQLLTLRLGQLRNENRAASAQISMAKRNNVDMAMTIARDARQMLGGMGITGEYPIMRHMMNLESVVTYEGTHDIHLLITGLDVTGLNAFK